MAVWDDGRFRAVRGAGISPAAAGDRGTAPGPRNFFEKKLRKSFLFSVFPDGLFQVFMLDVHAAADEGDDGLFLDFTAFQVIIRLVDGGAIHLVFFDRAVVPVELALARCRCLFLRLDVETGQGKEEYPYCFFHVPVLMRCGLGV